MNKYDFTHVSTESYYKSKYKQVTTKSDNMDCCNYVTIKTLFEQYVALQ